MTTTDASAGPTVQELLAADSRPVPAPLLDQAWVDPGVAEVSRERYFSPDFAALESRYIWRRTWQMACLEAEIPNTGDHVVYDVADQSLIVVRTSSGDIKAYHNSCLHRGTKLCVEDGRLGSFRCPFHGWRWDLEGNLAELPAGWDFPQITEDPAASALPQASVATAAGFVFVSIDPTEPFETYAGKFIEHFGQAYDFGKRYKAAHTIKEVPFNWKVCMEAFSEAYHVIATHPQILDFCADENSQYTLWEDFPHVSRFHNAFGVASPHREGLTEQQVSDSYHAFRPERAGTNMPQVEEGTTAREVVARSFRAHLSSVYKRDLDTYTDAEVLDAILYHVFPAFAPWAGVAQSLVYRWRPGSTPDTSIMDVMRMQLVPEGEPVPPPCKPVVLTIDQDWNESPGMGSLAAVFAQDMDNLPRVQAGLKTVGKKTVSFARYQEGRLRHMHQLADKYIDEGLKAEGRSTAALDPFRVV